MVAQGGPYIGGDGVGVGSGVDQHASLRIFGGDLAIGLAQAPMEFYILGLEPVGRAGAATGSGALYADFEGNIEDDGEVRLEVADRDPLHCIENRRRDLPQPALI